MRFSHLTERLRQSLVEDSAFSDVTTRQLGAAAHRRATARLLARQNGVFCGAFLLAPVFRLLDPRASVSSVRDGAAVRAGQTIGRVTARLSAVLAGERVFLNLATHLSGIASLTRQFAQAVKGGRAAVLDTRKTTPLWRDLEKYAVRVGGGKNHRFSLGDAILVKDNHQAVLRAERRSVTDVYGRVALAKSRRRLSFVEVEATNYREVWDAIRAGADIILLDNMPMNRLKICIDLIKAAREAANSRTPLIEVSGGVDLEKARACATWGVDRISVGALTHSAPALDLSLEVD